MPNDPSKKDNSATGPAQGQKALIDRDANTRDVSQRASGLSATRQMMRLDLKTGKSVPAGPAFDYPEPYRAKDRSSYKRGGIVRKTGLAKLHKGERVLTKRQNRKYGRSSSRSSR